MAASRSFSRTVVKWLPWVSALVLVAGGVAFLIAFFGNTAAPRDITADPNAPKKDLSGVPTSVPVDPKARLVAGKFITTAVTRQNLKAAWELAEPNSYIRPAGLTYRQWLTGNIPVQFFPPKAIAGASYKVESSFADELTLNVYIYAKPKSGLKSQPFFIVLHPKGEGKQRRWLVNNFVPSSGAILVPAGAEGGVGG